jgi:hypothetical protein
VPLLNDFKIHAATATRALPPGDVLRALSIVRVAYGSTSGAEPDFWTTSAGRLLKPLDNALPQPKGWVGKALLGVGGLAFASPSVDLPKDFPEHLLGGRTCAGPRGSRARQVESAVGASESTYLAVTDRGVVWLRQESMERMAPVLAFPRNAIIAAERRPRALARGRFGLVFDDGSWVVLSSLPPHIGSWHAAQVVAALRGGS